jgi:hypothetical protein
MTCYHPIDLDIFAKEDPDKLISIIESGEVDNCLTCFSFAAHSTTAIIDLDKGLPIVKKLLNHNNHNIRASVINGLNPCKAFPNYNKYIPLLFADLCELGVNDPNTLVRYNAKEIIKAYEWSILNNKQIVYYWDYFDSWEKI